MDNNTNQQQRQAAQPQQAQQQYRPQPQQAQPQYRPQPQPGQQQYRPQPQQAQPQYRPQPQQAQPQYRPQPQQAQPQYAPQPQQAQQQYRPQPQPGQPQYAPQAQQAQQQYRPQPQPGQPQYAPQPQQAQQYPPQPGQYSPSGPALPVPLKTNRSFLVTLLLSIVTLGIYPIIVYSEITTSINTIASRYDGKKTMHYCLVIFLLTPFTLGIGTLVWGHNLASRIENELKRRHINYNFTVSLYWLSALLGVLTLGILPIVYTVKLFEAMNLLSDNYNNFG